MSSSEDQFQYDRFARAYEVMEERVYRMQNSLKWINWLAFQHYAGAAFEPEHMRDLGNIAADALNSDRPDQPDFDEVTAKARETARGRAAVLARLIADEEANDPLLHPELDTPPQNP